MRISGMKMDPALRAPYGDEQLREGWLKRRQFLEVGSAEVLFAETAGQVTCFASSGSQPERVEATKYTACLYGMREFDLRMDWVDVQFARGVKGAVRLWTRARWPTSLPEFKLNQPLTEKSFSQFLAQRIAGALEPAFEGAFGGFVYEPLCNTALATHLGSSRDAIAQALQQRCGLLLPGTLRVEVVRAPEIDAQFKQAKIQQMQQEQRRREAQDAISRIAANSEINEVAYAAHLKEKKALLDEERIALEATRQREEVRVAIDLTREQARQKQRLFQAEAERKEAEAEAARIANELTRRESLQKQQLLQAEADRKNADTEAERAAAEQEALHKKQLTQVEIERNQAEAEKARIITQLSQEEAVERRKWLQAAIERNQAETEALRKGIEDTDTRLSRMDEMTRHIADTICARTNALQYQIANLEAAMKEDRKTDPPPLALVADWRAHGESGILIPRLGANEKLPTGILLDVVVTVNRDAYVYVLLQDSAGVWVSLIPELPDTPIMGVKRSNRQQAGEVVVWPDANDLYPDSPPQWQLQPPTGYERLIVLASETEIDVARVFRENQMDGLLKKARPLTRSLGNPGKTGTAASPEARDYSRVITVLRGTGSVCQETVVEHLSA